MPHLPITEDPAAPANSARVEDGRLVISSDMMQELREFMQSDAQMVESVARAIATAREQNGGPPYEIWISNKHSREALFDDARAAITTAQSFASVGVEVREKSGE